MDLGYACKAVDTTRRKVSRTNRCICKVQLGEFRKVDRMTIVKEKDLCYVGQNASFGDRFSLGVACVY